MGHGAPRSDRDAGAGPAGGPRGVAFIRLRTVRGDLRARGRVRADSGPDDGRRPGSSRLTKRAAGADPGLGEPLIDINPMYVPRAPGLRRKTTPPHRVPRAAAICCCVRDTY